ncbi:hypothetical protein Tco_1578379 [Tanacetum coccineum]
MIVASGVGDMARLFHHIGCKRRYKKTFRAAQKAFSWAVETASRAAGGGLVVARDEPAGSASQPGSWLVLVERKLKKNRKQGSGVLDWFKHEI